MVGGFIGRRNADRLGGLRDLSQRVGHEAGGGRNEPTGFATDLRCGSQVPQRMDRETGDAALAPMARREHEWDG